MNTTQPGLPIANGPHPKRGVVNPVSLPVIAAGTLFGKNRELLIEHAGSQYRLRITQNNKLILTK